MIIEPAPQVNNNTYPHKQRTGSTKLQWLGLGLKQRQLQIFLGSHICQNTYFQQGEIDQVWIYYMNHLPRMEKKIMNPADIWTTLRLPTRVNASKPAFSLESIMKNSRKKLAKYWWIRIFLCMWWFWTRILHRNRWPISSSKYPREQNAHSLILKHLQYNCYKVRRLKK